jgi:hypothetical protein
MPMRGRLTVACAVVAIAVVVLPPVSAVACSPPFDPSIEALGPGQLVVVGATGERVGRGRLFHVERWYNGGPPTTPIIIAFKEGEPIGDCSYPVAAGMHLIIAPFRLDDGSLYADLGTLQADPDTEAGRAYVAEAEALFGPGVVPRPEADAVPADDGVGSVAAVILGVAVVAAVAGIVFVASGRSRA